jgi:hypothetical protein
MINLANKKEKTLAHRADTGLAGLGLPASNKKESQN